MSFIVKNAVVKSIFPQKGCVFIGTAGCENGGRDIFSQLKLFSIFSGRVAKGDEVDVEVVEQADGRWRAVKLLRLGEQQAPKPKSTKRSVSRTRRECKEQEPAPVLPSYYLRHEVDHVGDRHLIKVVHARSGEMVQYVILTKKDGQVIKSDPLGPIPLALAREKLGKVIEPPKTEGHGIKTNDPTVSRRMAQAASKSGGGEKKVA